MGYSILLEVAFGQLIVFDGELEEPFNDWTDQHVSQGFAWRPGSVSFRTLVEAGLHRVDVGIADFVGDVDPSALRIIDVPFEVPLTNKVELGSVVDSADISISHGLYLLRCAFFGMNSDGQEQVKITFARRELPRFSLVRADSQLSATERLLTTADPAAS